MNSHVVCLFVCLFVVCLFVCGLSASVFLSVFLSFFLMSCCLYSSLSSSNYSFGSVCLNAFDFDPAWFCSFLSFAILPLALSVAV